MAIYALTLSGSIFPEFHGTHILGKSGFNIYRKNLNPSGFVRVNVLCDSSGFQYDVGFTPYLLRPQLVGLGAVVSRNTNGCYADTVNLLAFDGQRAIAVVECNPLP